MSDHDLTPTHSNLLALQDERLGLQEGYRFLDEKRLVLAAECLAELHRYQIALATFTRDYDLAVAALREAVARHGVEGLEVYPAGPAAAGRIELEARSVLGVILYDPSCRLAEQETPPPTPFASPEALQCRERFRDLIPRAARLAALTGNLERLREDYARTARRARALEDVLLPEIDASLREVEAALEESEREEAIRARSRGRGEI
jgi:V/A-type H+/Na+-transporting ATPase subunit D